MYWASAMNEKFHLPELIPSLQLLQSLQWSILPEDRKIQQEHFQRNGSHFVCYKQLIQPGKFKDFYLP